MRVVLTRRAEQQLDKLHRYIAERAGDGRADAAIGRIVTFCRRLALAPQRGTKRDDLLVGLRTVGFERRATIAFVVMADHVVIAFTTADRISMRTFANDAIAMDHSPLSRRALALSAKFPVDRGMTEPSARHPLRPA